MPDNTPQPDLKLSDFNPRSQLVTRKTRVPRPRFPIIDGHNHLTLPGWGFGERPTAELLDILDAADVRTYIDLDGGWGEDILNMHLDKFKAVAPERFHVYGGVAWDAWPDHGNGFGEWAAKQFRAQVARGAQGLKIWKNFGLHVKDHNGNLVAVDDARMDPLWATAGELGVPVLIHVADPVAFFDPIDAHNERYDELHAHPEWNFPSPPFPGFMAIIEALATIVERHPKTTFIGAHIGCYAENLPWVAALLDRCPNFYVDISERIGELGRQPYSARRFFITYADRIIFGTDCPPSAEIYELYYRFMETDDEYFSYNLSEVPRQGRWYVCGMYLPDDVLQKVYYDNAAKVNNIG